jgi:hypothetical protein
LGRGTHTKPLQRGLSLSIIMVQNSSSPWWGTFSVPLNARRFWAIGPLSLLAERYSAEWQIACSWMTDPLSHRHIVASTDIPEGEASLQNRVAFRTAPENIELRVRFPQW